MEITRQMPLVGIASFLEFALWYAEVMKWAVFPCKPARKEPLTGSHGFKDATLDPEQIRAWWAEWPTANIAVAVPDTGWWVLDIDARHGGVERLADLEASYSPLERTLTCLTGSGGGSEHRYFAGTARNKALNNKAVDVQGPGSYVILPPSIHPESGQRYMWESDYGPDDCTPQAPPPWLQALVTAAPEPAQHDAVPFDPHAIIPNGARNTTIYHTLRTLHRHGASVDALRTQAIIENERCETPLPASELESLIASAQNGDVFAHLLVGNGTPVGWGSPLQSGAAQPANDHAPTAWMKDLFMYKSGELKQNAFNLGQILRNHPYWQAQDRRLWYDVIRGYHMCGVHQISKALATKTTQWFGGEMRLAVSNIDLLKLCLEAEAYEKPVDLLQHHIEALPEWDHTPRLEHWLHTITGAADEPYTSYLSRALPVSMIARVLQPGCPCRLVLILEGKENIGKSHLVEAIATSEWYTILSMSLEGKDSHIMLHKYWLAEFAELDSLSRTEEARMKAFVTMETDTYVPKYSNVAVSIPRRTVFMGTTNDASGYLKGQTGNTRYYPLAVGEKIDVKAFQKVRDQIFAEALVWYSEHGDDWWCEPDDIASHAKEARELRRAASDYEQPLHEWLEYERHNTVYYDDGKPIGPFARNETAWPEIARWFLKIDAPEKWKDRSLQLQIASALKALGWKSTPVWRFGRTTRVWAKPEIDD